MQRVEQSIAGGDLIPRLIWIGQEELDRIAGQPGGADAPARSLRDLERAEAQAAQYLHRAAVAGQCVPVDSTPSAVMHLTRSVVQPGESDECTSAKTKRILFVDDEAALVRLGCMALERMGFVAEGFTSSDDAFERFSTDPDGIDLIITDYRMPGLSGEELSRRVLEMRPSMPIVLCTGYSNQFTSDDAIAMGIRSYLEKPLSTNELQEVILISIG